MYVVIAAGHAEPLQHTRQLLFRLRGEIFVPDLDDRPADGLQIDFGSAYRMHPLTGADGKQVVLTYVGIDTRISDTPRGIRLPRVSMPSPSGDGVAPSVAR